MGDWLERVIENLKECRTGGLIVGCHPREKFSRAPILQQDPDLVAEDGGGVC